MLALFNVIPFALPPETIIDAELTVAELTEPVKSVKTPSLLTVAETNVA